MHVYLLLGLCGAIISLFIGMTFVTVVPPRNARTITPEAGRAKVKSGALLLDVRTPQEFADGHLEGAVNIPYDQIQRRLAELGADRDREIVTYCQAGVRSGRAQQTLQDSGFKNVFNGGGYLDWMK